MESYELLDRSAALRRLVWAWNALCGLTAAACAVTFVALVVDAATSSDPLDLSGPAAGLVFMLVLVIGAVWAAGRAAIPLVARGVHRLRGSDVAS
jgi:hypothetical protein